MQNRTYNVPDIANESNVYTFYDVDGNKITVNSFILSHPKTNERVIQNIFNSNNFHLRSEDAIKLANTLMSLALEANEINRNENAIITSKLQFRKYLEQGKFKKVTLEYVEDYKPVINKYTDDEEPTLQGYKKFIIRPEWKPLSIVKPDMDYYFIDYIFISPFYSEFERQMDFYGGVENINFVNFNHEEYVSSITDMLRPENMPVVDDECNCDK